MGSGIRAQMKRAGVQQPYVLGILFVLVIAGFLRLFLLRQGVFYYSADSGDYLVAADHIFREFNFMGPGLYDWRLPAYPAFLAGIRLLSNHVLAITWVQSGVGMVAALVGLWMGRLVQSRLTAVALLLFLALSPIYLFIERFVMTESLFLLTLLLFTALVLRSVEHPLGIGGGALLGFLFALNGLIRLNSLFFLLPFVVAVAWLYLRARRHAAMVHAAVAFVMVASFLLGAWIWRNDRMYDVPSLSLNTNRNRIIYLKMHGLLDSSLPQSQILAASALTTEGIDPYALIYVLSASGTRSAEAQSQLILDEQLSHQRQAYMREVALSVLGFAGMPLPLAANERSAVRGWYSLLESGESLETLKVWLRDTAWRVGSDSPSGEWWQHAWRRLGEGYFLILRPLLAILGALSWLIGLYVTWRRPLTTRRFAIQMLGIAYLCTVAAHAIFLADYDRFSLPFDWVYVALVTLTMSEWRSRSHHVVESGSIELVAEIA